MSTRDPRDWMWAEACELLEQADRLQRRFFQLGQQAVRYPTWEPPIDIVETERELHVLVALPGVAAEDVQVLRDGGALTVIAERHIPTVPDAASIRRIEIPHGHFERRIPLDDWRLELVARELVNGCLVLTFRKLA